MKKRKFMLFFVSMLYSCVLFCGCAKSESLENNLSSLRVALGAEGTVEKPVSETAERAERIRRRLLRIDGIQGAHVVIRGRTALIGITVITTDTAEIDRIKKEAAAAARQVDKEIRSTAITANGEISEMIADLEEEAKK